MTARFKRTAPTSYDRNGAVDEYVLELRPGHTIKRVDYTSRLGAGRKGRAAEVSLHRELTCSCGGRVSFGGLTVAEDLAKLRHYESAAERQAVEAADAELAASIIAKLSGSRS